MHSVYMITDRSGGLMYIGCTSDIYRRQAGHRSQSPWFADSWMIHHKAYRDRAYAERVEARAIRRYKPPFNKRDNPNYRPLVSFQGDPERTKAGMAAAVVAGKKLGPKHTIRDNPKRMALARKLDEDGLLRDDKGDHVMRDRELLDQINAADPKAKRIQNIETVRRWRRDGYEGLDQKEGQGDG